MGRYGQAVSAFHLLILLKLACWAAERERLLGSLGKQAREYLTLWLREEGPALPYKEGNPRSVV